MKVSVLQKPRPHPLPGSRQGLIGGLGLLGSVYINALARGGTEEGSMLLRTCPSFRALIPAAAAPGTSGQPAGQFSSSRPVDFDTGGSTGYFRCLFLPPRAGSNCPWLPRHHQPPAVAPPAPVPGTTACLGPVLDPEPGEVSLHTQAHRPRWASSHPVLKGSETLPCPHQRLSSHLEGSREGAMLVKTSP